MATAGTAAQRCGRLVTRLDRTAIRAQPSPNAEEHRAGDDGLGRAGEDDQGEDQGRHGAGGQGAGDHAACHRPGSGSATRCWRRRVVVGRMSTLMTVSLSQ